MKKLITMILIITIALSTMVVPTFAGTKDQPSSWAQEYVKVARERNTYQNG
jgi:type II secretory pathway component PulF